MVERHITLGQLMEVTLTYKKLPQDLYMAWKITNKGKGLSRLKSILLHVN